MLQLNTILLHFGKLLSVLWIICHKIIKIKNLKFINNYIHIALPHAYDSLGTREVSIAPCISLTLQVPVHAISRCNLSSCCYPPPGNAGSSEMIGSDSSHNMCYRRYSITLFAEKTWVFAALQSLQSLLLLCWSIVFREVASSKCSCLNELRSVPQFLQTVTSEFLYWRRLPFN